MTKKGFTLVEILIVVLVLGIIAAITLPQFSNASAAARASMLADNLRILRTQIAVFKGQHMGVPPGYPDCETTSAPTAGCFVNYMTLLSKQTGQIAALGTPGFNFGPYFSEFPTNPVNNKASVEIIGDGEALPGAPDDSHGWIYKPATLTIKADSGGSDEDGKPYFDY